jgi:hypothetical protein
VSGVLMMDTADQEFGIMRAKSRSRAPTLDVVPRSTLGR